MSKYEWSRLNHLQLGRCAEYFAKIEFALHDFEVFDTEVDNQGIDFIVRKGETCYYDMQVKSSRDLNYIFFLKSKFKIRENLLAVVALFADGELPKLFLIPSTAWLQPNSLLVDRDYVGRKSKPEYGLNLSHQNLYLLAPFEFDESIKRLEL